MIYILKAPSFGCEDLLIFQSEVVDPRKLYSEFLEIEAQKRGIEVNYPPTPKAMGWASRVNAPTNVGNLP